MLSRRRALGLLGAAAVLPIPALPAPAGARPSSVPVADGLAIQPRSAWAGADAPTVELPAEDVRFLLVHHTASSNDYGPGEVADVIRGIHRFHTGPERGWPDICYHFFVDRYGGAWEARSGSLAGPVRADATGGNQGFAQLCCLIGDFTNQAPTPEALLTTTRVLAWLADRYGVDTEPGAEVDFISRGSNRWPDGARVVTSTIAGHRDMSQTECPGDRFYPYVRESLPLEVEARRSGPSSAPVADPAPAPVTTEPPRPAQVENIPTLPTVFTDSTPDTAPPTTAAPPSTVTALPSATAPSTTSPPTTPVASTTLAAATTTTSTASLPPSDGVAATLAPPSGGGGGSNRKLVVVGTGVAAGLAGLLALRMRQARPASPPPHPPPEDSSRQPRAEP